MLQLLHNKNNDRGMSETFNKVNTGLEPHKVHVRSFFKSTAKISEAIKRHAHLQDLDFLAKEDLGLGQVLLINALDGHFPICLLWNTWRRTERTERFRDKAPLNEYQTQIFQNNRSI